MNRLTALPLAGFLSVLGVVYLSGSLDGVPAADRIGGLVIGLATVLAIVAGYSFGRGYRDDGDE